MNIMEKSVFTFFILSFIFVTSKAIDPFSKITITSEKATCKKSSHLKKMFIFNYLGNVVVTLADGSKITAQSLEITLDGTGIKIFDEKQKEPIKKSHHKNKSSENPSNVKRIVFKNSVKIINKNREAFSDAAEVSLQENTCKLDGNVKIIQSKGSEKNDIPLNICSNSALINLTNSEITLLGNSREPVSTVVELGKNILTPSRKTLNAE